MDWFKKKQKQQQHLTYYSIIQYIPGCGQQKLESKIVKALWRSMWQQESLIVIQ